MTKKEKSPIFLQGKRVNLRPLEESDLQRCMRWINDPKIRKFVANQMPMDLVSERKWFDTLDRSMPRTDIILAIVLRRSDRHVGIMGLHRIDWINRHGTTGAIIGEEDCWNKGYGAEAKSLLLEYAFQTLNLHRINSSALAINKRSLAYLKKSGYRVEGCRRRMFFRNGRWVDEIALGILASEWRAMQKRK